jgi:Heme/copper-type cytochrome/quinol oxidases, subunit 2
MKELLGLPVLASEHGKDVDNLIIYVHWLMILLFVGWLAYFAYALFRFHKSRNPKADYVGVKNHASNYIEGAVAIIEGVLLIGVAVPLWAKAVDKVPKDSESTVVQVVAQQFAWNVRYPGKDGIFAKQDMKLVSATNVFGIDLTDPNGKDDPPPGLNEIHAPFVKNPDGKYRPVVVYISSKDVIHSFKVIALRITQDAIPGMRIPVWFRPTQEGRFQINCAQLCGNGHSTMASGFLVIESQAAFDKWIGSKAGGATQLE